MFSGAGDQSMQSIAYQSARDNDSISDDQGNDTQEPWTRKKSTEEVLNENLAPKKSPTSTKQMDGQSTRSKVYMKSIEKMIPYNKMALHGHAVEKYLEQDPKNKVETSFRDMLQPPNFDLAVTGIDSSKAGSRNPLLKQNAEYDIGDWIQKIDLSPVKA